MAGVQSQVRENYLEMPVFAKKKKCIIENLPRGFSEANSSEVCKRQHAKSQRYLSNQINTHVCVWQWPLTDDLWEPVRKYVSISSQLDALLCFVQRTDFCLVTKHTSLFYWCAATVWAYLFHILISFFLRCNSTWRLYLDP